MRDNETAIGRNKSQDNCFGPREFSTELSTEESNRLCSQCGAKLCPHDICFDNWCGHDYPCCLCSEQREREREAAANAEFYSHPGWKEVFGGEE